MRGHTEAPYRASAPLLRADSDTTHKDDWLQAEAVWSLAGAATFPIDGKAIPRGNTGLCATDPWRCARQAE